MKKLLILFSFFLFFNASLDESNIDIKLIKIDSIAINAIIKMMMSAIFFFCFLITQ